jgi:hypothetical protein
MPIPIPVLIILLPVKRVHCEMKGVLGLEMLGFLGLGAFGFMGGVLAVDVLVVGHEGMFELLGVERGGVDRAIGSEMLVN